MSLANASPEKGKGSLKMLKSESHNVYSDYSESMQLLAETVWQSHNSRPRGAHADHAEPLDLQKSKTLRQNFMDFHGAMMCNVALPGSLISGVCNTQQKQPIPRYSSDGRLYQKEEAAAQNATGSSQSLWT